MFLVEIATNPACSATRFPDEEVPKTRTFSLNKSICGPFFDKKNEGFLLFEWCVKVKIPVTSDRRFDGFRFKTDEMFHSRLLKDSTSVWDVVRVHRANWKDFALGLGWITSVRWNWNKLETRKLQNVQTSQTNKPQTPLDTRRPTEGLRDMVATPGPG